MTSDRDAAPDMTPAVQLASRQDPQPCAGEADTLLAFLDYERQTFRIKCGGLTGDQLARTLPPSDMTLGGMIKHLAWVEVSWFSRVLHGRDAPEPWSQVDWTADEDWDWHSALTDSPTELMTLFEESVAIADDGMGTRSVKPDRRTGEAFALRWIVTHLIEEYARHNGHADLIRQSIDGSTGE